MFDNAIFASLIPQFLMVLGFFSVIIAPNLTSQHSENNKENEAKIESISLTEVHQISEKTAYFSKFQHTLQDCDKETIAPLITFPFKKNQIFFSNNQYFTCCKFSLHIFSRPPPLMV